MSRFDVEAFVVTDTCVDLADVDEVYVTIPKEEVVSIFKDYGITPTNPYGNPSDSFTEGDLQYVFSKEDHNNPVEVLLFPVYGGENGEDFVRLGEDHEYRSKGAS